MNGDGVFLFVCLAGSMTFFMALTVNALCLDIVNPN